MSVNSRFNRENKGVVLVLVMVFLVVFSCLTVSLAALSGVNLQMANNNRSADYARYSAESGLEVIRHWLDQVSLSGNIDPNNYLGAVYNYLTTDCNLPTVPTLAGSTINLPSVGLDSANQQRFIAAFSMADSNTLSLSVTGQYETISQTVRTEYLFGKKANSVFNYGVASRGPLSLSGNIDLSGQTISIESNAYIESLSSILALEIIGNSSIDGTVSIANPLATVDLQGGHASIGGLTGQEAIDNNVDFGVPQADFPEPVPGYFEHWVTNEMDPNVDTSADATFENIRIPAGLNPHFTSNVSLRGVIYIETPNVVTFSGNVDITGIIVGNGNWNDDSRTNQIVISGTVSSQSVSALPNEPQFEGLQEETGTFMMAPGFQVSMGGNFSTLAGSIAGNGIAFYGNAGGTIDGSVVNYSNNEMTLDGNSDLIFNRSGLDETPAGFVPQIILSYDPTSYSELVM